MIQDCGVKVCSRLLGSFLDCDHKGGKECGRLAHIHPVLLQRRATRPPSFNLFPRIGDEPFFIIYMVRF